MADPAGPSVSGQVRRQDIAAFLTRVCPAVTVRAVPKGWMISRRTGGAVVAYTFEKLIVAVAPHCRTTEWGALDETPPHVRLTASTLVAHLEHSFDRTGARVVPKHDRGAPPR